MRGVRSVEIIMLVKNAGVVAVSDDTTISFALPPTSNVSVTFLDRTYRSGEIVTIVLDVYGTFELQTSIAGDLTGCRVYANKPIAVFSGNRATQVIGALKSLSAM
jgi:IgGFc binding protein